MSKRYSGFDIENFTSFIILKLWAGNIDLGDNWYAARMLNEADARWRLFVWDADVTLGLTGYSFYAGSD